ncbi:hypothetical protein JY96_10255 [Aquabacterium sp. NJ1]|uniref:DUF1501 domain-containing protein n=1 Tax=Aquabacterium sp. NJ1 TaxID=1538295 RepID=UPI00052DC53E|nr:DUF1501 domain-containing protein [Aquabacterium sp. NJ1]KGM40284.1 hypothetical protein JY96_10255 [Aquabacterium sp. NJ1]
MSFIHTHADRRLFLRQSAALGALAGSSLASNLALIGAAAAQSTGGYRALVCINLAGGNDNANTVVPVSPTEYAAYAAARQSLALPTSALLRLSPTGYNGPSLALHPSLARLQGLFNSGKAAVMANVGTLAQPITKDQWDKRTPAIRLPYQLFSHSDQSREWQTGVPDAISRTGITDTTSRTGWLGRAGDLLDTLNSSPVSICMSLGGNNMLQVGNRIVQYQLTAQGPVALRELDSPYGINTPALRILLTDNARVNKLERELTAVARRAISTEAAVSYAIAPSDPPDGKDKRKGTLKIPDFGGGNLGAQLRMVARMIAARQDLGHTRQIFYVSHGGYDMHSDLLTNHARRLAELDTAIADFYLETVALGVSDQVTTFTASEFGRALQSNGDGSDHGWGAHHFVVGGAVHGQRIFGQWPTVALKSNDDAGNGRLIPTTAVDQYAATLATWLGVDASLLSSVLPNIGRFASSDLGFFSA